MSADSILSATSEVNINISAAAADEVLCLCENPIEHLKQWQPDLSVEPAKRIRADQRVLIQQLDQTKISARHNDQSW